MISSEDNTKMGFKRNMDPGLKELFLFLTVRLHLSKHEKDPNTVL